MRAAEVVLTDEQRATLRGWLSAGKTEQRMAFRAEVILAIAEGLSNQAVAERLDTRPATVSKWRGRFARAGFSGLLDAPRSGKPRQYQGEHERRILAALDEPPPAGYGRWDGRLLARHLGDISKHQIWRVLRRHEIALARRRSWCISTDPAFAQKAADIVGLYLQPPENAVVFAVDEKPHIQALERAQGWLKLPNGKAVTGFSHTYKRHETTTLFAALDVATGLVKTGHYQRRRRIEFLDFMNRLVAEHAGREIHVILDNLNTHKPKDDRWLARHKNVHFHFTPTHASWLNPLTPSSGPSKSYSRSIRELNTPTYATGYQDRPPGLPLVTWPTTTPFRSFGTFNSLRGCESSGRSSMPSALAGLPLRCCAASRSAEATFCGISLIVASTAFCFPSRAIVNSSLVPTGWKRQVAGDCAQTLFCDRCSGNHIALLDAGSSGRSVGGDRSDQRTGRMVRVETKALGDRWRHVLNGYAEPPPGHVAVLLSWVTTCLAIFEGTANAIPTEPPEGE